MAEVAATMPHQTDQSPKESIYRATKFKLVVYKNCALTFTCVDISTK